MSGQNLRGKLLLVVVLILFALPVLLAFALHTFAPDWRPWGTSNRGSFVTPPRAVNLAELQSLDGQRLDGLKGQWILVVTGNGCSDKCKELLHLTKQVHISLGREAHRVARLYIGNHDAPIAPVIALTGNNPGLRFASASPLWLDQFSIDDNQTRSAELVYIIDPGGYLMMKYSREHVGADIRKDLKRLLKASRGG